MHAQAAPSGPPPLTLVSRVPSWADGLPLIDYLVRRFRYLDASGWQRELAAGRLSLEGAPATGGHLRAGQRLAWQRPDAEPPVPTGFTILHEEAAFAVVDKPAHLPVHADGAFVRNTLVFLLRERLGPGVRLAHRLDRETSGLVVVARTADAHRALLDQFAAGAVHKTYLAVVHGRVAGDFVAAGPIGRATTSTIALRRAVVADGEPARTEFTLLRAAAAHSLLRCVPRTGRTHQLRVHLEAAGHPLAGDKLYGRPDADYLAFVRHVKAGGSPRFAVDGGPDRALLHAAELAFAHPQTGAAFAISCPPPPDFDAWAERLLAR
jgi:23S rRNA pseudouridine1911/1915/1917 synthase